ncbi:1-acyl-sn-glycerol-3-phosphate acyltransferase [Parachlamydia acanthamoebae]|uniref:1-acyl-sn-glycerol-3-phosphate acyltransferase n=1 Tax=Parachlamydia acanthamoebae TaxID=83552 RepID=UPI00075139F1|nr:1-acyl-sn-glycerol-3-phosphate acyltransferase [Parachlamydia acanthamoebae]
MDYIKRVEKTLHEGLISESFAQALKNFYLSYAEAITSNGQCMASFEPLHHRFLDFVIEQIRSPFHFEPFHQEITSPFNYYEFGLDYMRPLVKLDRSKVFHLERVDEMVELLAKKHNVILFANHQTEPDPQAISLLLENTHPKFAEDMIFVAGHRVVMDPMAVPFSKGRNLLCIYSKKYTENPPEEKAKKLQHNQRTMKKMAQLLSEGGKCIYVAPSGGRDRPDEHGRLDVAPFNPQSIEMFWLMSQQAQHPTHFYPLALATYDLLPPPNSIKKELGEHRYARCTPLCLSFGAEFDMEKFDGSEISDKKLRRKLRADQIWELVRKDYKKISEYMNA